MDALEELRAHIPGYADYRNEDARHEVDKQIRAYLGEALAVARERTAPAGPLGERLEGLILRCEFSDQRVIRAADHASFDEALAERVHELDLGIVQVADRIRTCAGEDALAGELDEAARLLDGRFGVISDAPQHR